MAAPGQIPVRHGLRRAGQGARARCDRRRDRAEDRGGRGTRLSRRLRGRPARGQGGERPPRRRWRWRRSAIAHPRHRARASPASKPGWRPKRSKSRSRWRASCAAELIAARAARRDHRAGHATASRIWSRPRISSSASTIRSTRPRARRSSEIARQSGFEGRLVMPGRAGHRQPATAGSNGPTAAWCWSARRSKRRSDELVGRYMASRDSASRIGFHGGLNHE